MIDVAAALALEEGGDAEPLPLFAEPLLGAYEDCFTRPGVATFVTVVELLTAGAGSSPTVRGSTPPVRGGCAICSEARDGTASAERGDLDLDLDGDVPDLAVGLLLPVPERGEERAALRDKDVPDPLCGDDGDGTLAALAGDGGDAAPGGDSGKLLEAVSTGFADSDATASFVFSARAAARKATRDGDGLAVATRGGEAAGGGEAALVEVPLEGETFPAAARAEASVVAGRAEGKSDVSGSDLFPAGTAIGERGAATTGTGAETAGGAVRVPPDRALASVSVISRACAVGLRLGASEERSASPGMRPPRSVAFASALADVSSHEMSSAAPL